MLTALDDAANAFVTAIAVHAIKPTGRRLREAFTRAAHHLFSLEKMRAEPTL